MQQSAKGETKKQAICISAELLLARNYSIPIDLSKGIDACSKIEWWVLQQTLRRGWKRKLVLVDANHTYYFIVGEGEGSVDQKNKKTKHQLVSGVSVLPCDSLLIRLLAILVYGYLIDGILFALKVVFREWSMHFS